MHGLRIAVLSRPYSPGDYPSKVGGGDVQICIGIFQVCLVMLGGVLCYIKNQPEFYVSKARALIHIIFLALITYFKGQKLTANK